MKIAEARKAAAGSAPAGVLTVISAKLYAGFIGSSSLEIRTANDCTTGRTSADYVISNLGNYGFSDVTSSFEVFGRCAARLYDDAGCPASSATFPGATTWAGTTSYVGDRFNDKATCLFLS